jgi:hypothetical protein
MAKIDKSDLLLGLETLAISLFAWQAITASPLIVAGLFIALVIILSRLLKSSVSFLALRTQENRPKLKWKILLSLSPSLLLYLTFLQYFFFLSDIDPVLMAISGLGSIYLLAVFLARLKRGQPRAPIPTKRLARRLFFVTLLAYILYLSGLVFPAQPFSGDEPHYLLITKSLVSDGDINLYNNYQNKDYLKFYPGELDAHAYPGKKGERFLYSKHFPGLPVLLAPSFFLGEKLVKSVFRLNEDVAKERAILIFFSRLTLCFLAAFLSAAFFLFASELTRKRNAALLAWFIFSFTAPVLFYSHLIYPEIPVALILLLVAYHVIQKKNLSASSLFGAGVGIGLLPWFGIKYIILAVAIFCIVTFLFLRSPGKNLKKVLALASPLVISAGLFILTLLSMYGALSPQTIYKGTVEAQNFPLSRLIVADLMNFFRRLLGYFFDQRVGIFVFSPAYILLLPGLFFLAKRSKKEASLLIGLFSVFYIFCSLNYYWGGYVPPARPLLPVLWIPALLMAGGFALTQNKISLVIRNSLLTLSFLVTFISLRNPRLLYHESLSNLSLDSPREVFSNLLTRFSNVLIDWRPLVPSLSNRFPEQLNWAPLVLWIPMIIGIALLFLRSRKLKNPDAPLLTLSPHLGMVFLLSLFLIIQTFFNIRLENGFSFAGKNYEAFVQDENTYGKELEGFWVKGKSEAALVIKTAQSVSSISLTLTSPIGGRTVVRLARRAQDIRRNSRSGLEKRITFPSPRGFHWKGGVLYLLRVKEENGFYPYRIDRNSKDARFLGVFVRIEVGLSSPGNL